MGAMFQRPLVRGPIATIEVQWYEGKWIELSSTDQTRELGSWTHTWKDGGFTAMRTTSETREVRLTPDYEYMPSYVSSTDTIPALFLAEEKNTKTFKYWILVIDEKEDLALIINANNRRATLLSRKPQVDSAKLRSLLCQSSLKPAEQARLAGSPIRECL
jgi:lipocalin